MGTNFFFKSLEVHNFRVFKKLKVNSFKRINILSGVNGSGKTALIESLFLSVDLSNPACLLRPFMWRGIPLTGDDLQLLFPNQDSSSHLEVITSVGKLEINLRFGKPDQDLILAASKNLNPDSQSAMSRLSASTSLGVNLKAKMGTAHVTTQLFFSQTGDTVNVTGHNQESVQMVTATYLAPFLQNSFNEVADRVSKIIRKGKKPLLIEYLKVLNSEITDVEVLQDGQTAQLYVVRDNKYTPLALMGGGLRALTDIVSCVMVTSNGVVMIDELDAALHYSIVPKLWEIISKTADAENVQIFAVTHSRETIEAAAVGVRAANRSKDFQYIRVDELEHEHKCTIYNIDELSDASEMNVEVR